MKPVKKKYFTGNKKLKHVKMYEELNEGDGSNNPHSHGPKISGHGDGSNMPHSKNDDIDYCQKILEDTIKETMDKGGNGENMRCLEETAKRIDSNHQDAKVPQPGEPGWYTNTLVDAFKTFCKAFSEEEIKYNHYNDEK